MNAPITPQKHTFIVYCYRFIQVSVLLLLCLVGVAQTNTTAVTHDSLGFPGSTSSPIALDTSSLNDNDDRPQISSDHWSQTKVNPYKRGAIRPPFKLVFDQETYTMPVRGKTVITSRFGKRRRGPHRGIDIDLVSGDTVRAMLPGKVRFVGYSRGHGKTVVIRHANDVETVYAHLSGYNVSVNDEVTEGHLIGRGGRTGNARGSHLHLEVRYKGICIHPEYLFDFEDGQQIRASEIWVTNGWKNPLYHSSYRKSKVAPLLTEETAVAYQKKEPRYHKIRRGDTLGHLAIRYDVRLSDLCNMNRIRTSTVLKIGRVLQVR